jgi:hypothetical protein
VFTQEKDFHLVHLQTPFRCLPREFCKSSRSEFCFSKRIFKGFFAWTYADDSNVTVYDNGRIALNIVFLKLIVQAAMARVKLDMSFKFQSL